jgi:hydroxymethylpyrimidine/phosphomethylpyrimidine kinase
MKTYRKALTIAGSDSGGGAGIQADLKTFSALGCYGMTAITAVTAQNTLGVTGVWPMSLDSVEKQLDAVLSDIGVDAVKIGMLWSAELAASVAGVLMRYGVDSVVLDPVMAAQSGDSLFSKDSTGSMFDCLAPVTAVITPNLGEAARILGYDIPDIKTMETAARDLAGRGFRNVLIKGGHLSGNAATDVLYLPGNDEFVHLEGTMVDTRNNHGTGCTLSSAICAFLAQGKPVKDACGLAKEYITQALRVGAEYTLGSGHGPVAHFHGVWT